MSSHLLKRVNLSYMGSPKNLRSLNLTAVNTANASHIASPREESLGRGDGPVSLLDAQLSEAKGRLRKGLALTLSTQAIRDALVQKYRQELDQRKLMDVSQTLLCKPMRLKTKKTLSLDYKSPRSPSSPVNSVLDSFLAAGKKIAIQHKQTIQRTRTIRHVRLMPRKKEQ